jgi:malonyl-CoA O-methyltransferase
MASIDHQRVAANFGRAAARYEVHARLQGEVRGELLERLDELQLTPGRVVDIGCGTGLGSQALKRRYRKAEVLALDLALPMLQQARSHRSWWRPFRLVQADARALPFADDSVDLIFSSLCLQWCEDLPALFAEWSRVLKPGGVLLFASFGLDTLAELRAAFSAVDDRPHLLAFPHIQQIGDAMLRGGLVNPVLDRDLHRRPVSELRELLAELKGLGANNALSERGRGLMGKGRWQRLSAAYEAQREEGRLPVSWEVVYGQAHGGEPRPKTPAGFDLEALRATLPSRKPGPGHRAQQTLRGRCPSGP